MLIRSLVIGAALCLYGTSASAQTLTMEECRAKYKAAQLTPNVIICSGTSTKKSIAALSPKPVRRNQPPPHP